MESWQLVELSVMSTSARLAAPGLEVSWIGATEQHVSR